MLLSCCLSVRAVILRSAAQDVPILGVSFMHMADVGRYLPEGSTAVWPSFNILMIDLRLNIFRARTLPNPLFVIRYSLFVDLWSGTQVPTQTPSPLLSACLVVTVAACA